MIERSVNTFVSSIVDEIIVIVGEDRQVPPHKRGRLTYRINPDPARGLSSSLKTGLLAMNPESECVVVGLGDKPLVLPATVNALASIFRKTGCRIAVPVYRGRRGNPVLFSSSMYEKLERLSGDVGAKEVIRKNPEDVVEVAVTDPGILLDIDTPSDIEKALVLLDSRDSLQVRKPGKQTGH